MKNFFKYIGLLTIILFSFYYTDKMSNMVINKSELVTKINEISDKYNIQAVSATIEGNYITPGINGNIVNVLKSYEKMKGLNSFDSNYLVYDKLYPGISIENNKDKIIKRGNINKKNVAIIVENNIDIINYSKTKNIKLTRLIDYNTYDKYAKYEQINCDYENYNKVETMLNNSNNNKNICYVTDELKDICLKNNKYLVEATKILNNNNIVEVKNNIKEGYIIYIKDNVNLINYKLLLRQIYYQDLNITYLSHLITEERD